MLSSVIIEMVFSSYLNIHYTHMLNRNMMKDTHALLLIISLLFFYFRGNRSVTSINERQHSAKLMKIRVLKIAP